MTPIAILKRAVKILSKIDCSFCLIGGHAASLYRDKERFTRDVDFALEGRSRKHSVVLAETVIRELKLEPAVSVIPGLFKKNKQGLPSIVTSKPAEGKFSGVIDILLPPFPWLPSAVRNAQDNLIDLGFERVPVITPEDLIVSKCFALNHTPDRFQDLDDIKEILLSIKELDLIYLQSKLKEHEIPIPKPLRKLFRGISSG